MSTPPKGLSSFRWAPHFPDQPELEQFSRNTFNGLKDLNAALKALNTKHGVSQGQINNIIGQLNTIAQQITTLQQQITNITNTVVTVTGTLDCGTFSGF